MAQRPHGDAVTLVPGDPPPLLAFSDTKLVAGTQNIQIKKLTMDNK